MRESRRVRVRALADTTSVEQNERPTLGTENQSPKFMQPNIIV